VDLDDMTERRPDGSEHTREASLVARPEIRLLRPVCVTAPTGTRCFDHPGTTQATLHPSGRAVHAEGVAVFSMAWLPEVYATFEGFDTSVQLADTARLPTEGLVLDDCCESVRWSDDGTTQLTHVRGRIRPEDKDAHWHFLLDRPICGIGHVPGDARVVSSFTIEGRAALEIPIKGLPEAVATATLRGRSSASSSYAAEVMRLDEVVELHSGGVLRR
jgi:hypothetical protein